MPSDDVLYKTQTKQICHIIASKVNNHMTWISTNNKHLKLGISPKFDQLQNIPLTQTRCHDNSQLENFVDIQSCPQHISLTSHWLTKMQRPPFQLSHWSSKCMAHYNFLLLIIIPGIHSLACFVMTRSLII